MSVDATAVAGVRIRDQSVHDASIGTARRHGRGDEFPLLSCLAGLVLVEVDDLNSHRGMYRGACLGLPTFEQRTGSCPRCARHRTGSGMPTASHNAAINSVPKMALARRGQAKCLDGTDHCQMAPGRSLNRYEYPVNPWVSEQQSLGHTPKATPRRTGCPWRCPDCNFALEAAMRFRSLVRQITATCIFVYTYIQYLSGIYFRTLRRMRAMSPRGESRSIRWQDLNGTAR